MASIEPVIIPNMVMTVGFDLWLHFTWTKNYLFPQTKMFFLHWTELRSIWWSNLCSKTYNNNFFLFDANAIFRLWNNIWWLLCVFISMFRILTSVKKNHKNIWQFSMTNYSVNSFFCAFVGSLWFNIKKKLNFFLLNIRFVKPSTFRV